MSEQAPTKLVYLEGKTGFSIAHVADEIADYEAFAEIIFRDQRIPRNLDPNRLWLPLLDRAGDRKLGVAKNAVLAHESEEEVRASKFYDWAFQGRDKYNRTFISGLYRQHRPMLAFEGDYSMFSQSPFVVFAFSPVTDEGKLEATIDQFFESTGLTPVELTEKDIAEFEAKKKDIVWTIDNASEQLPDLKAFSRGFNYEMMQGNELYDRFVTGADFGL